MIYLAANGKEKDSFRARLAGYFLILNLFILPSHIYAGLITTDTLKMAGLSIIPLLAGVWGGIFLAERISEGLFRKVVLLVILASGMASGISGAMSLMYPPG